MYMRSPEGYASARIPGLSLEEVIEVTEEAVLSRSVPDATAQLVTQIPGILQVHRDLNPGLSDCLELRHADPFLCYHVRMNTRTDTKTWLVVPDLQVPLHDAVFTEKLIEVAKVERPDGLLFIGDLTDSTEVGQWVKGKAGEYTGDLQSAFDETARIVGAFRRAVGDDTEMVLIDSNHDSRMGKYISDNAPAIRGLRGVDFASNVGLRTHHVSYVSGPYEYLPGCVAVHGHERAYSQVPGKWGLTRAVEYGMNVAYGHTHTPLLTTVAQGLGENRRNLWVMNVGHGMDMSQATYLSDGYATWAQAFGVVTSDGENSFPELYIAQNGSFCYGGEVW
jgi:predicted phosphodiesterase